MQVTVKAPAKINLALDIVGVDERGYHLMNMLMQTIDLYDFVTLIKRDDTQIWLSCNRADIPCNNSNICDRCAQLFFAKTGIKGGVDIHIEKNIPQQAGMAGGSTDGAATLVGLNRLFQTNLTLETLCQWGAEVGADIPFCLIGGTAKVTGFGEKILPIAAFPDCSIVVAKPRSGISTQRAFAEFDRAGTPPQLDLEQIISLIEAKDLVGVCSEFYNALETVCNLPDLPVIKNSMRSFGAKGTLMTGSGSAIFGVFTDRSRAYNCEQKLRQKYHETFLCRPVTQGACIVEKENFTD